MRLYEAVTDIVAHRSSQGERAKWSYADPELLETASCVAAMAVSLVAEAPVKLNEVGQLPSQLVESSV